MKTRLKVILSLCAIFIFIPVLSIYSFVKNNQFLLTDEYIQKFISYLDDNNIVEIKPDKDMSQIQITSYTPLKSLNSFQGTGRRELSITTFKSSVDLQRGLPPEEFQATLNRIPERSTELDGMLSIYSGEEPEKNISLIRKFDSKSYPVNGETIKRALAMNAIDRYLWGIALSSNHPFWGFRVRTVERFHMLFRLPVIPLIYKIYSRS